MINNYKHKEFTNININNDKDMLCPECGTQLSTQRESREGSYSEFVDYCKGCGYTAVQK